MKSLNNRSSTTITGGYRCRERVEQDRSQKKQKSRGYLVGKLGSDTCRDRTVADTVAARRQNQLAPTPSASARSAVESGTYAGRVVRGLAVLRYRTQLFPDLCESPSSRRIRSSSVRVSCVVLMFDANL
ncbi:hypothetical protein J6590_019755 [Homalodisca vitripennis]|nr:hypothetical protein J6590_019755 [Homalodisca vitripennis]